MSEVIFKIFHSSQMVFLPLEFKDVKSATKHLTDGEAYLNNYKIMRIEDGESREVRLSSKDLFTLIKENKSSVDYIKSCYNTRGYTYKEDK